MRFSTFMAKHGPVKKATHCTGPEWESAVKENRFCTVYHSENDHATPVEGVVGRHGFVNTLCKLMFTKPLPPQIDRIIGMRNSPEAFDLCND